MEGDIPFIFRGKVFWCNAFIDSSEYPCYLFVMLDHSELVQEFGNEVTIKTDCEQVLARADDYPALVALRKALFAVIKPAPECIAARKKMQALNKVKQSYVLNNLVFKNRSQQIKPQ